MSIPSLYMPFKIKKELLKKMSQVFGKKKLSNETIANIVVV